VTVVAPRPAAVGHLPARAPLPVRASVPVLASAGAGLALLFAFPPYRQWWLAPAGVALLALACHGRRARVGAALGFLCGAVYLGAMLRWTGLFVGAMPWLLLSGLQACYVALLGAATSWVSPLLVRRPWTWAPVTGVLWVGQEALRDRTPFGGFPWARLAFSQADSPLLGLAALGGAPLVTFGAAMCGGLLAAAVVALGPHAGLAGQGPAATPRRREVLRAAALVGAAGVVGLSGFAVPRTEPAGAAVTVAIVQGNVPRIGLDFNAQRRAVLDNHVEGTRQLAARVAAGTAKRPGLVIWPENSSDIDPLTNPDAAERIQAAADAIGAPILVGAVVNDPASDDVLNTGLVWHPGTGPGDRYVKRHPVPFGEYVPLRALARLVTDKVDLVRSDFVAGDRPGVLTLGPARVGDVICFEVAYDDVVRDTVTAGGELLVVQTNNATFNPAEATQQLAMVRLRAVEHGRYALMASTVGVSGFVDAHGRVYGATSFFSAAIVVRELHVGAGRTLATRLGPAPEYLLVVVALGALLVAARARRRAAVTSARTPAMKEDQ
jgi:apolipoprotein N-acyltransferase